MLIFSQNMFFTQNLLKQGVIIYIFRSVFNRWKYYISKLHLLLLHFSLFTGLWDLFVHTINFIHLKCTVQWFLVYSQSCSKHRYNLISRPFQHPPENLYPLAVPLHSPSSTSQPQVSYLLCVSWPFYVFLFWMALFWLLREVLYWSWRWTIYLCLEIF